eukprot:scaffold78677_cov19-Prasinocladus_malaysianus.AAC.1
MEAMRQKPKTEQKFLSGRPGSHPKGMGPPGASHILAANPNSKADTGWHLPPIHHNAHHGAKHQGKPSLVALAGCTMT